jgi:excisionase family DNA binding protein
MNRGAAIAPRLLSARDAAAYLAVSTKTIRRLMVQGLPVVRINSLVRFDRADLDSFAERNKQLLR